MYKRHETALVGPASPAGRFSMGSADKTRFELLRRIESGQSLTLAEYVRAEEVLVGAMPARPRGGSLGQISYLRNRTARAVARRAAAIAMRPQPAAWVR